MAFKVCIVWAIRAVALIVSSAIASPSPQGSSSLTLASADVTAESLDENEEGEGAEEPNIASEPEQED